MSSMFCARSWPLEISMRWRKSAGADAGAVAAPTPKAANHASSRNREAALMSEAPGVINGERGVIAELLIAVDRLGLGQRRNLGRGEVVVQPPAHVLRVGLAAVAPP